VVAEQAPTDLVSAFVIDSEGRAQRVGWDGVRAFRPDAGCLWVHLDRFAEGTKAWIDAQPEIDRITTEALLAEETRPRCTTNGASMLLLLRGVNLNPGADPEDMVTLRVWADANRLITVRGQRVLAARETAERLDAGERVAASVGDLLATLAARLIDRMGPVVDGLQDEFDGLEEQLIEGQDREVRRELSGIRRQAVSLRRYMSPQRDVLARLSVEMLPWLSNLNRARFRETTDRVTRYVEDLDATRERAAVTQEELTARTQDRMNRNMYILSLVAALFLPLGFITGLLGINVAGIPGADFNGAFLLVCIMLGVIAAVELAIFYFKRWL